MSGKKKVTKSVAPKMTKAKPGKVETVTVVGQTYIAKPKMRKI